MNLLIFISILSLNISLLNCDVALVNPSYLRSIIPNLDPLSDQLINAINDLDASWKAGKNFDGRTFDDVKKLFMTKEEPNTFNFQELSLYQVQTPQSLDLRNSSCSSISQILEQTSCTPSWLIASVGQIADRICIKTGKKIDVQSTVDHLMTLNGGYSCEFNSANIGQVFNYWSSTGITTVNGDKTDECLPFFPSCLSKEIVPDQKFNLIPSEPKTIDTKVLDLTINGPIIATMEIYSDFLVYKSGIYQKISNKKIGTHTLKIIGYGIENGIEYWLAANSWGTQWGDNGFIKIQKGIGEFGSNSIFISTSLTAVEMSGSISEDTLFYLQ